MDFDIVWIVECRFLAKILAPEGSKEVAVGQPIAITIEDPNDLEAVKASAGNRSVKYERLVQQSTEKDVKPQKMRFNRISPMTKLLLLEHGLDASSITASGPRGTLLKRGVLTAIKSGKGSTSVAGSMDKIYPSPPQTSSLPVGSKYVQDVDAYEDLPNSQIRKVLQTEGPRDLYKGIWCENKSLILKIVENQNSES